MMGMEIEDYMRRRLAGRLGFGVLGLRGGGSIAVRSTDVLRFAYLMLHEGRWGQQEILTPKFARMCGRMVKYNPHFTHQPQLQHE